MKKALKIILIVIGWIFIAAMFVSCIVRVSFGESPEWGVMIFGSAIGVILLIVARRIRPGK
jgi:hypothetical protein